jgi:hypothetical protein
MAILKKISNALFGDSSPVNVDKTNKWEDELESIYQTINDREKFNYDMNKDALHKQYSQQYQQNAELAMQDTVGQISALTGGYGNSYAETAGQAIYNQTMGGMNEKALQLYQLALNTYNSEGDRLMQIYGITSDQYQNEFNRIRAEVADEQWRRQMVEQQRQYIWSLAMEAAGMAIDVGKFAVGTAVDAGIAGAGLALDAANMGMNHYEWQQSMDYQRERDAISDARYQQELALKYAELNNQTIKSSTSSSSVKSSNKSSTVNNNDYGNQTLQTSAVDYGSDKVEYKDLNESEKDAFHRMALQIEGNAMPGNYMGNTIGVTQQIRSGLDSGAYNERVAEALLRAKGLY